ncbi:hypothetical protein D3C85_788730 [compost metagenome]
MALKLPVSSSAPVSPRASNHFACRPRGLVPAAGATSRRAGKCERATAKGNALDSPGRAGTPATSLLTRSALASSRIGLALEWWYGERTSSSCHLPPTRVAASSICCLPETARLWMNCTLPSSALPLATARMRVAVATKALTSGISTFSLRARASKNSAPCMKAWGHVEGLRTSNTSMFPPCPG